MISFSTASQRFVENGLALSEAQYEAFSTYESFLVDYNQKVNLTAITQPEEIWMKHFVDSVFPLRLVMLPEHATLIDVGTGAGFPSVPMGIYRPDLQLTLLDSLQKRIVFLEQLAEKTGLQHCTCIHGRAEEMGQHPAHREQYDVATARAVAAMPVLCEYCLPFVKVGGVFLALKGPNEDVKDALYAVKALGAEVEDVHTYSIGGEARKLFVLRKISQTPTNYPRKSNRIQQKPLIG